MGYSALIIIPHVTKNISNKMKFLFSIFIHR
jgi:hypothetical protein